MKITRSDGPITTLAQAIGRVVITQSEYDSLMRDREELQTLKRMIKGAVSVRENF